MALRTSTSSGQSCRAVTLLYPLDAELDPETRSRLLGTKASSLHEMTALGIPVPPGFTITTDVGAEFRDSGKWPGGLRVAVEQAMDELESRVGQRLRGRGIAPLGGRPVGSADLDAGL